MLNLGIGVGASNIAALMGGAGVPPPPVTGLQFNFTANSQYIPIVFTR
jgi:hypothetical protein